MPLMHHPTLMDILRWGTLGAALWAFINAWEARRAGRRGNAQGHRQLQLDASTLANLGWLLAAATLILWWLPLN